jgi:hypothetical protein
VVQNQLSCLLGVECLDLLRSHVQELTPKSFRRPTQTGKHLQCRLFESPKWTMLNGRYFTIVKLSDSAFAFRQPAR